MNSPFYENNYKLLIINIISAVLVFLSSMAVFAAPKVIENPDSYSVSIPAGTIFRGVLENNISTVYSNAGDDFILKMPSDVQIGDVNCIPKNSKFIGKIVRLGRADAGRNGFIEVLIDVLKLPDGQEISVRAHIWTKDDSGVIGGELAPRTAFKRMRQSIERIGEVAQLIPDGPRSKGKETEILVGSEWIVVLDRELKLIVEKDD